MTDDPAGGTDGGLTPDLVERVRAHRCAHCGGTHARACPRVKRLAYHPNGTLAEVEFWPSNDWPEDHIIWPEYIDVD